MLDPSNENKLMNTKIKGYYVSGKNNCQLVRDQLDLLGYIRYDSLPVGGAKFNWITRNCDIDWKTFDSSFQILNHIFNENHFSNKGFLLTNLRDYEINIQKLKQLNPKKEMNNYLLLKTFLPETYLLDNINDRIHFKKSFKQGSTWICKPVGLSCGREVFLFRNEEELEFNLNEYHKNNAYSTLYYNRLVQKYIENPLLINKHKFDIRTYLLCISTSNHLLCFASQIGYLRLSMYEYDLDNTNKSIHLTNQSIQNKNKEFLTVKNQTGMTMEEFHQYFNEYIQPNLSFVEKDWVLNELPKQITKILNQVVDSVRNKLILREGCFGFYGVDILIDNKLNCWLLEINSGPTLDMTNQALEKVIPLCLHDAINIVIQSLDNYRSTGSLFPLPNSNIFKYLPPSDHLILSPSMSNHIPNFISMNNRRIDLTPGGLNLSHRHRRLSSTLTASNRVPHKQVKTIDKKSTIGIKNDRPVIIHTVKRRLSREQLSHQLTKLIQMNKKSLVLNIDTT